VLVVAHRAGHRAPSREPAAAALQIRTRLYVAALLILAAGFGAGGAIYASADEGAENLGMQELLWSKQYTRDLQRFGGKAAVLFDDFNRWFAGLWHGKSLGLTIIWLSVFASGCVYLVARRYKDD
jgi:hypothetical protein